MNRFTFRALTGLLTLTLFAGAVASLSLAGDPDPIAQAEPPAAKTSDKPARPPEDEDPNAQTVTNHKVKVNEGAAPAPKTAPAPRRFDLRQAARDAKKVPVQNLFHELAVPHDVLVLDFPRSIKNIMPIPEDIGDNPETISEPFKVTPYPNNSWNPEDPIKLPKGRVVSVKPYERLALKAVDDFLKENHEDSRNPEMQMSRYEQCAAAEVALSYVYNNLLSERQTGQRAGGRWQLVEDDLKKALLGVDLEELNILVKRGDWEPAYLLTKRLAAEFAAPEDQDKIAQPLADLVYTALAHAKDEKQRLEARDRLRLMQALFPYSKTLDKAREKSANILRDQARELIAEAERELKSGGAKRSEEIGRLLNEAEDADPNAADIRKLRLELTNERPTLRVGVRELPAQMSPALAGSDADLRAVELMFESLVKLHTDGDGGSRWEPGLAEGPPRMWPRGRQFQLAAEGQWSNGRRLTAGDVRETVGLIQEGKIASRPPVWGDLLDKVVVGEASRVNLTLPQGWLDPLALMNFKVLPSGLNPASAKFAADPVGSGPFMYDKERTVKVNEEYNKEKGRECKVFVFNTRYSARPSKAELRRAEEGARFGKAGPRPIEEIRFIRYNDAMAEMHRRAPDRCDLMLDLTAKEAASLEDKADELHLQAPAAKATNRRIYFLAVNHRNPALANAAFRRALAYAIHRDALLSDFRGAPLNGPYPAKSWACNPALTLDPFNIEKAKASMAQAVKQGVRDTGLKLEYPNGDAPLKSAMEALCKEVGDNINVTLTPVAKDPAELRHDVETTYSYDLAYYHYDFPDDVYWLGPLLDPRGGPGDQNYMGYSGALVPLVRDISRRRDFPEVRKYTYILHDKFLNEEMPFIPLWRLDALSAVSNRVVIPEEDLPFDPVRVFTDVERWRLKEE